ncbi:anti-repressor SinI family protein [Neobacillus cucumis]|nr:anti-repressor SinI family protein [Neobacillus cucumis]MDR4949063.1 anti-repressor SinI family protein [Neobacillus cucumis]
MSVLTTEETEKELDQEWLALIAEAKQLGLTINEIRDFLKISV